MFRSDEVKLRKLVKDRYDSKEELEVAVINYSAKSSKAKIVHKGHLQK
jgi:hypothetical protein